MWPCSHLITQRGARNCYVPVAVWTWPPSLFCLFICKLIAVWDSILAATRKTEKSEEKNLSFIVEHLNTKFIGVSSFIVGQGANKESSFRMDLPLKVHALVLAILSK